MRLRVPNTPDITGSHFIFTVKEQRYTSQVDDADTYALFQKTITFLTDPIDPLGGFTDFVLSEADLDHKPGRYVCDVVYVDINGVPRRSKFKTFIILPRAGTEIT